MLIPEQSWQNGPGLPLDSGANGSLGVLVTQVGL